MEWLTDMPCEAEDTEEMFWLRESDDYQSKLKLGNLLAAQYRFKEAAEAYRSALLIRQDDAQLYIRLGGAELTLGEFEKAYVTYQEALKRGAGEQTAAYPLGVWHYLKGQYETAAEWFAKCLPCNDELKIAVIYWHCLCCLRKGRELSLIGSYHKGMQVGHHEAYKRAVAFWAGEITGEELAVYLEEENSELDYVIAAYGLFCSLSREKESEKADRLLGSILEKKAVWPCISYLAAWKDAHGRDTGEKEQSENGCDI